MGSIILTSPLRGWATAVDDVPDAVFANRMLGDGVAVDPLEGVLCAPCDGEVLTLHANHHAITLRGDGGVEILMHIGIDTVALKGAGFTPRVAVGDKVTRGQTLINFDLDAIALAAPSLLTPIIITNGDRFRISRRETGRVVGMGEGLLYLEPLDVVEPVRAHAGGGSLSTRLTVPLVHGIHARPAARIGETARQFVAESWIVKDGREASTRSPVALLQLGVLFNDEVEVVARGAGAAAAIAALRTLIESGMGEAPGEAPLPPRTGPAPRPLAEVPQGCLRGTTAAPGIAVGRASRFRAVELEVPRDGQAVDHERARLEAALLTMQRRLDDRSDGSASAAIRRAQLAFFDDPTLRDAAFAEIADGRDAGHGWRTACRAQADVMRGLGDPRLAERADDLLDIECQILRILADVIDEPLAVAEGAVLLADELLPSQMMEVGGRIAGLVLERGGPTSHVAILAASLGLPALVAAGVGLREVAEGATLFLDADAGLLHVDPPAERLVAARLQVQERAKARAAALTAAAEDCVTRDGVRIEAFANLGSVADADAAVANGAEGCGLLRTEFLFLERDSAPDVGEQAALYGEIARRMRGRSVIVRLLDIGGDKPAPYLPMAPEENPALGLRGIRASLAMPEMLDMQLRAILSVRPYGQCKIMVPMVASATEIEAVRDRVEALSAELGITAEVEVGIMVETPAAAVTSAALARHADFLSIGTNDLTQYALAMDRGNPAVAAGIDGLHPAVLRLIALTAEGAATHDRWVGVCGGLASDRLAVPLLVGLGVTELSAAPHFVPELKALVRQLTLADCRAHAERALQLESPAEVRELARRFEEEVVP